MKFAIQPDTWAKAAAEIAAAGHEEVTKLSDADFFVYGGDGEHFPELPDNIAYVQTTFAGLDDLLAKGKLDSKVRWANAAGLYSDSVAEGTLGLMLGAAHMYALVTKQKSWEKTWRPIARHSQFLYEDKTVAIIGAGGIGKRLIELLKPFGCHVIAVNRSGNEVHGAQETVPISEVKSVWGRADFVVLLAPLTSETHHLVDADVLKAMRDSAFLINSGRGGLVDTDALVEALRGSVIAGAGLDVTEPEPLPDGHPLWELDNCLITPHATNTPRLMKDLIGGLAVKNAELFLAGERMATEVDVTAGY